MKSATLKDLSWVTVQLVLLAALWWMPAFGRLPSLVPMRPLGLLVCIAGLVLSGVATWQLQAGRSLTPMPSPRAGAALLTAFIRFCPLYAPLGISTCGKGGNDKGGGCCGGGKCC